MTGLTHRLKVKLKGGGPWGFRLLGGAGTGLPLTVAKIRRKSKSYKNLEEGDLFVSVNGVPCENLTYDEVMCIADKGGAELCLEIERKTSKAENAEVGRKQTTEPADSLRSQTVPSAKKVKETKIAVTTDKKIVDGSSVNKDNVDITNEQCSIKDSNNYQSKRTETQSTPAEHNELVSEDVRFKARETPPNALSQEKTKSSGTTSESLGQDVSKAAETVSDISARTTSEVTPTCEKYEKVQTEKVHEKIGNKETTTIRTDHEEVVKSHAHDTTSSSPEASAIAETNAAREEKETVQSVSRKSYEVTKSEKTEVTTTTKVNGFAPFVETAATTVKKQEEICSLPEETNSLSNTFASEGNVAPSRGTTETFTAWESQFDSSLIKKKKMFSSSSFYEEPQAIYPTVEEQVEMAKKIAESLADDTNKKSKGANMFFKRAKRSTKWVHEGPEPSGGSTPGTPEPAPEPFYPEYYVDGSQSRKNGLKLKLVLDPRHPIDAASLRSTGHNISEHNVISPEICHGLAKDLESPIGKGSALFAKRKKKSSEWVVDEEKVKSLMKAHERDFQQLKSDFSESSNQNVAPFRSPFDTSAQPAFGRSDSSYNRVDPENLAETVIHAAECKQRVSSPEEMRFESCRSPIVPATPAASYYDIYKPKAPKGWSSPSVSYTPSFTAASSSSGILGTLDQSPACQIAPSMMPRKYQFQNFNTLPRKWKSPY